MKGTSTEQDCRFSNKDKKLMKSMKFDSTLNSPVDMSKVMLDTMKTWIAARISDLLGFEDEVVIDYVYEMLENENFPNPQKMQIHLTGFFDAKNARIFMRELWHFLKSAQENGGIPKEFIELRMAELAAKEKEEKLKKVMADSVPELTHPRRIESEESKPKLNGRQAYERRKSQDEGSLSDDYSRRAERRRHSHKSPRRSSRRSRSPIRKSRRYSSPPRHRRDIDEDNRRSSKRIVSRSSRDRYSIRTNSVDKRRHSERSEVRSKRRYSPDPRKNERNKRERESVIENKRTIDKKHEEDSYRARRSRILPNSPQRKKRCSRSISSSRKNRRRDHDVRLRRRSPSLPKREHTRSPSYSPSTSSSSSCSISSASDDRSLDDLRETVLKSVKK